MERFQFGVDYSIYNIDLLEKMYDERICGVPLSFYLLDFRKTITYCHLISDILSYFIEGSNRVEGDIPSIPGDDKRHSWVEKGDTVFDDGVMWKKDSYYECFSPHNCVVISRESTREHIKAYLKYNENCSEMYVAIIRDMESVLPSMIYRDTLLSHIDRFKTEKNLDNAPLDLELVEKFMSDLEEVYKSTQEFLKRC